ncbi:UPF0182 family membrane protein [Nocardioides acrostichi]|uniref:UPF0182 protein ISG29_03335 n=1 Tax=Nocardioides acrostichi TaxID=2784339 RepID=A0A930UW24_9ACTN|nr:UPF0182 family protein [Nocardioides acrostichi]MBF4160707.1 UPF0182 family protein [Nocardioides acrostichi]
MSETTGPQRPAGPPPLPRRSNRSRALGITAVVLVVLFFGVTAFANFYTNRLWYVSGGYAGVFTTMVVTRAVLFVVVGLLLAAVVCANVVVAYRYRPLFVGMPDANGMGRYREAITPVRRLVVLGLGVVLLLFAGSSASGQWRTFQLWRNGGSFGTDDPYFGKDVGFFVFDLPWYHFLTDVAMATFVLSAIAAAVTHYLYGGISLQTPGERMSGAAQAQLSLLVGLFVLTKGVDYYLDRFDLASQSGSLITGLTYTDDNALLPAKTLLLIFATICAVLFFLNVWRRTWMLPSVGAALLVLLAILLGLIWPGAVQQFQVKPSELDREQPYIAKNIEATREAYDLTDVDIEKYSPETTLGSSLAALDGETKSIPLVDPQVVRSAFEQTQQVRAYYSVAPVLDVDRYQVDGTDRALVLGVRELNTGGIPDKNWTNLHTVYTHGNGIIAAYANQRGRDDKSQLDTSSSAADEVGIEWAQGTNSGEDDLQDATGGYEDRVYYGQESPDYSIVGKASADAPNYELNLPLLGSDEGSTTTFEGNGDASVGSSFNRFMFAIRFGEPNFVLSGRVNDNSKVLFDRDPTLRVQKVAPWLTVDSDPYPAIVDGRIEWVLDGYTTTDRFPGAQKDSYSDMIDDSLQEDLGGLQTLPTDQINYMRNAVKATVDAYSGKVTLYEWDTEDPILKAWEGVFPNTVQPKSAIPEELLQHLRYPEDLFKVQRYQLARYHVTNAEDWYQSNNRWEVPEDPYSPRTYQPPYRLFIDEPGDTNNDETFSLTSVYTPYEKANLASFVAVDSDATSADYGQMKVLELPNESTPGPSLVANQFASDPQVADLLAQFNRSGARPVYGNLLTLPVNDGLMYVQPVYASREVTDASFPILRYVLTKYGNNIGVGTTLRRSLSDLLSTSGAGSGDDGQGSGTGNQGNGNQGNGNQGTGNATVDQLLKRAEAAFNAADRAYAAGNLGGYQRNVKKAQDLIGQALALSNASAGGSESDDPSSSASPSESPSASSSAGG